MFTAILSKCIVLYRRYDYVKLSYFFRYYYDFFNYWSSFLFERTIVIGKWYRYIGISTILSCRGSTNQVCIRRLSSFRWHDMGEKASFIVAISRWFNNHLLVNNNRERGVIMIIVILLFLLNILSFLLCGYMLRNKG